MLLLPSFSLIRLIKFKFIFWLLDNIALQIVFTLKRNLCETTIKMLLKKKIDPSSNENAMQFNPKSNLATSRLACHDGVWKDKNTHLSRLRNQNN